MRSTSYSSLETGLAAIAGIDPTNILAHEKTIFASYLEDATRFCWDYYPWSETVIVEQRQFRPDWEPEKIYAPGEEVYYNSKYYRKIDVDISGWEASDEKWETLQLSWFSTPEGPAWYEIGDSFSDPEWKASGLYAVGARVAYKGKTYICIKELEDSAVGIRPVNYEYDKITPHNTTHFLEVDTLFKRYLPYQEEGKEEIGTVFSVHLDDPRYTKSTPVNWVEGTEGIYIEMGDITANVLWVRYRSQAPSYTVDTTRGIPSFLAPAVKAYAYRAFLIGDGQHEKAQLQDIHALDLLIREVDKLNSQQDRAQPYTITSEPYRRVAARGSITPEATFSRMGELKSSTGSTGFKFTFQSSGRNCARKRDANSDVSITGRIEAKNATKNANADLKINLNSFATGRNVGKAAKAFCLTKIFTGRAFQSIAIGEVKGAEISHVPNEYNAFAYIDFNFYTVPTGGQFAQRGSASLNYQTYSLEGSGGQFARRAEAYTGFNLVTNPVSRGKLILRSASADLSGLISMDAGGYQARKNGAAITLGPIFKTNLQLSSWGSNDLWTNDDTTWENSL